MKFFIKPFVPTSEQAENVDEHNIHSLVGKNKNIKKIES